MRTKRGARAAAQHRTPAGKHLENSAEQKIKKKKKNDVLFNTEKPASAQPRGQ